jgi:NSS family neurotransmitter:Na+ symporter
MPALLVILLVLVGYAMNTNSFEKGVEFLFLPDISKLTWGAVLTAMGHAFFTLSLGMGAIMVYGSYMPKRASIAQATLVIAIADTSVALLAGLAIFPVVFSNGLEAGSGPGLLFITLPLAFGHMQGGAFFATLFFVLVIFAAWTSAISLLEPAVTWLVENHGIKRIKATFIAGASIWALGIFTVFSFNKWAFKFSLFGKVHENGFFDVFDQLTANIMLPLGGMLIALFAGWFMSQEATRDELDMKAWTYNSWRFLVRYVSPFAILIVFLNVIGIISF